MQLRRVQPDFGVRESLPALRGGVQRVTEQERLLGGQEEVRLTGRLGAATTLRNEGGGPVYRIGDPADQLCAVALARLPAEEGGDGDGVGTWRADRSAFEHRFAEPVPAGGRRVQDRDEQRDAAGVQGDAQCGPGGRGQVGLPDPAAQQVLDGRSFGCRRGVRYIDGVFEEARCRVPVRGTVRRHLARHRLGAGRERAGRHRADGEGVGPQRLGRERVGRERACCTAAGDGGVTGLGGVRVGRGVHRVLPCAAGGNGGRWLQCGRWVS